MMYISKEVTSKDQQLSFQDNETKNSKNVWQESDFFDDRRSDLTIPKANFPENTLCHVNQCSVSLIKVVVKQYI